MEQMDAIAAVATPQGAGGLCVIRVSGKNVFALCEPIIRTKRAITAMESHTVQYGHVVRIDGTDIDECMFTVFHSPKSFTAEDTLEISCHGGLVAANEIMKALFSTGVRLAKPGEFTMRAFLNGRLDLSQAEAVNDIIHAKTDAALTVAVNQLEGNLSNKINQLRATLLTVSANIAAATDFPEEDIEELTGISLLSTLEVAMEELEQLLKTAGEGKMLREGVRCAIVGSPNAGKSSLLNRLLSQERAIVTDVAGTTRDIIEEYINIEGIPVCLGDTAGIRETADQIESIGVSKTREYIAQAEICIFVLDGSKPLTEEEKEIFSLLEQKKTLLVMNKNDLPKALKLEKPHVCISAKTGDGMDTLLQAMYQLLVGQKNRPSSEMITNIRHKEACIHAREALGRATATLRQGLPADLAYIDLEAAIYALGEITGETVSEEIVHEIFGKFCLGK